MAFDNLDLRGEISGESRAVVKTKSHTRLAFKIIT